MTESPASYPQDSRQIPYPCGLALTPPIFGFHSEENPVKAGLVSRPGDWPQSSAAHYQLGEKDPLIDSYEFDPQTSALPRLDQRMLEGGGAIGSELFLLHLEEGLLKEVKNGVKVDT